MIIIRNTLSERGEHDVVRKSWHWFRLQTSLYHETLCGAFSESWSINGEAEVDIGCLWFLYPFNGSKIKDWLFRPQTMFCLWPFVMPILGQLCRGRTVLCVLFFWKGNWYDRGTKSIKWERTKEIGCFCVPAASGKYPAIIPPVRHFSSPAGDDGSGRKQKPVRPPPR